MIKEDSMNKKTFSITTIMVVAMLVLAACSGVTGALANTGTSIAQTNQQPTVAPSTSNSPTAVPIAVASGSNPLTAYQDMLQSIYSTVSKSVVSIMVLTPSSGTTSTFPGFGSNNQSQLSEALGSGFVWDTSGHIVTNDHVVSGATTIEVTFADGNTYSATIVGQDPYSDLAVIQVKAPASELQPVTMGDSSQLQVGDVAITIGNPFGLPESMSTGIISGLNRDISNSQVSQSATGATYSIPDVIQTDAAINPGNSGGVLVNDQGQVVGVTYSLESASGSSSGIGFAIPQQIVSKVVPSLISSGTYNHPYLGITGADMTTDIAKAMNLPAETHGAMVVQVVQGGPAAKAGLQGSNTTVTINGAQAVVGGDVITAINGQAINSMADLIAYLELNTQAGQSVTLTVLRNGQSMSVPITLGTRPAQ
jgi:serine protease Do